MIVHEFHLDIVPGPGTTIPKIYLSQNDEDFSLVFHLFARTGTLTVESGTTAKMQGVKSGGTAYEATASIKDTTVTVSGDKNLTSEAGKGTFELCLTHGSKKLHTANFSITVEKNPAKEAAT